MVKNSFKWYIGIFIFYIIFINYAIYIYQNLIFGPNGSKSQLSLKFSVPNIT